MLLFTLISPPLPHVYEYSKSLGFGTLHCGIARVAALLSGVKPLLKTPVEIPFRLNLLKLSLCPFS